MSNLRESLGASGFDPNYENITVEALKRGRNGDGRHFEVDVTTRAGKHLGLVCLRGGEHSIIGQAVGLATEYEVSVEVLGQRIANLLTDQLAIQHKQRHDDGPQVYAKV